MFLSHLRAGTGVVFVEARDEQSLLRDLRRELNGRKIAITFAPSGPVLPIGRDGIVDGDVIAPAGAGSFAKSLAWASDREGDRCIVVFDLGVMINAPGCWRALLEALPKLRNAGDGKPSLVICAAPIWNLDHGNPLRGLLPILSQSSPNRQQLAECLENINGAPALDSAGKVLDSLSGLSCAVAEQTASESLIANAIAWNPDHLRLARRARLLEGGLTVLENSPAIGGLTGVQSFLDSEIIPWIADPQLFVRRILCAGLPGTGKSYWAQHLAFRLGCECVELSIPRLKAGIVGASESNLRRALETAQALADHAPLVLVIDEIDTIAREGMDGGTSAGMFSQLLTWLHRDRSKIITVACLNRLDKLDAALADRFSTQFFFDLPAPADRESIASIHLAAMGCADSPAIARHIAEVTEGFSAREIAEKLVPSLLRQSRRAPTGDDVIRVARTISPTSKTMEVQLKEMRDAGATMTLASGAVTQTGSAGRRLGGSKN